MAFLNFVLVIIFVGSQAVADRYIPRRMSEDERHTALQILGFGSASKTLANPYPLGGQSGVEMGVTTEYIPSQDLKSLGDKSSLRSELNYYSLSISKGLFYNIDTSVHFTPAFQNEDISSYGGQLRWGFYEFTFLPGGLSAILHGSATNFGSLLDTRTTGVDLVATVVVEEVALYFGFGQARALGNFRGGTVLSATDTTRTESTTDILVFDNYQNAYEDIQQAHTMFGVSLAFSEFFAAFQIDRYYLSSYAAKIGWRF